MEPNIEATSFRPPRDGLYRIGGPSPELRDSTDGDPEILVGHFTPFNQWAEIHSKFEGDFLERTVPGAFKKSFSEPFRSQIKVQFGHGGDFLGEQLLGLPIELEEDDYGARYAVELFDGIRDAAPLLMSGLRKGAYGASYYFSVLRENVDRHPRKSDHNPDGLPERTIKEVEVFEFGPVTWPAFVGATAGIRSASDHFIARKLALANVPSIVLAPSWPGAADEPHPEAERSEPLVVTAPVPPRFKTQEDFLTWISRI